MRLVERVDEPLVVSVFLRGELDSERFGPALRAALERAAAGERLVREPALDDAHENAARRAVLEDFRGGYLGRNLDRLTWWRAELGRDEVLAIRFIAWDYWLEVTGGTRAPAAAAAHFLAAGEGEPYLHDPALPLIVVRADAASHLMVVEGHGRLSAMAMNPEQIPEPLDVLLGEGESISCWSLY